MVELALCEKREYHFDVQHPLSHCVVHLVVIVDFWMIEWSLTGLEWDCKKKLLRTSVWSFGRMSVSLEDISDVQIVEILQEKRKSAVLAVVQSPSRKMRAEFGEFAHNVLGQVRALNGSIISWKPTHCYQEEKLVINLQYSRQISHFEEHCSCRRSRLQLQNICLFLVWWTWKGLILITFPCLKRVTMDQHC